MLNAYQRYLTKAYAYAKFRKFELYIFLTYVRIIVCLKRTKINEKYAGPVELKKSL